MRRTTIWIDATDEPQKSQPLTPVAFSATGLTPWNEDEPFPARAVMLVPAEPIQDGRCGVVLVADELANIVLRNGLRLEAGMHLLRHADHLQFAGRTLWVSSEAVAEEEPYDENAHGEDCFCFRTKARFTSGEPIVRCPGTPTVPCGALYKAAAWELGLACHGCGHDPSQKSWTPPTPLTAESSRLNALLELVSERAEESARG